MAVAVWSSLTIHSLCLELYLEIWSRASSREGTVFMNAEYSDRSEINKKHGVTSADYYADSAMAFWLKDKDAVEDKLAAYYAAVVRH